MHSNITMDSKSIVKMDVFPHDSSQMIGEKTKHEQPSNQSEEIQLLQEQVNILKEREFNVIQERDEAVLKISQLEKDVEKRDDILKQSGEEAETLRRELKAAKESFKRQTEETGSESSSDDDESFFSTNESEDSEDDDEDDDSEEDSEDDESEESESDDEEEEEFQKYLALQRHTKRKSETIEKLEMQLYETDEQRESMTQRIIEQSARIKQALQYMKNAKQQIRDLQQEIDSAKAMLSRVTVSGEITDLKSAIEDLISNSSATQWIKEAKTQIRDLEEEIKTAKDTLSEFTGSAEIPSLNTAVEELVSKNRVLQDRDTMLQNKMSKQRVKIEEMEMQKVGIKADIQQSFRAVPSALEHEIGPGLSEDTQTSQRDSLHSFQAENCQNESNLENSLLSALEKSKGEKERIQRELENLAEARDEDNALSASKIESLNQTISISNLKIKELQRELTSSADERERIVKHDKDRQAELELTKKDLKHIALERDTQDARLKFESIELANARKEIKDLQSQVLEVRSICSKFTETSTSQSLEFRLSMETFRQEKAKLVAEKQELEQRLRNQQNTLVFMETRVQNLLFSNEQYLKQIEVKAFQDQARLGITKENGTKSVVVTPQRQQRVQIKPGVDNQKEIAARAPTTPRADDKRREMKRQDSNWLMDFFSPTPGDESSEDEDEEEEEEEAEMDINLDTLRQLREITEKRIAATLERDKENEKSHSDSEFGSDGSEQEVDSDEEGWGGEQVC